MKLPEENKIVLVTTKGGKEFLARHCFGVAVDENENPCWSWCAFDEDDYPDCWTDGICWTSNDDQKPSDPVVSWRPAEA